MWLVKEINNFLKNKVQSTTAFTMFPLTATVIFD